MLVALVEAGGEFVQREALIDRIWGHEAIISDNALDVCASALRRRLASECGGVTLETSRGLGYALKAASRPADED